MNKKMEKKFLLITSLLLLASIGVGFTIGSVYTQNQLNSFTPRALESEVGIGFQDVKVDRDTVWFEFDMNTLEPTQGGVLVPSYKLDASQSTSYLVVNQTFSIGVSIEALEKCVADVNETIVGSSARLGVCKSNYIRPLLVKEVRNARVREVNKISEWQAKSNSFTREDFLDIVDSNDLKPARGD